MALRKYGTSDDQKVTEVETTGREQEAMISKAAARGWTEEDERDLQDETER